MPVHTVEVGATGIMLASIAPHAMLNVMSVGRQAIIEGFVKAGTALKGHSLQYYGNIKKEC